MAYRNMGLCFTYQTVECEDKKNILDLLASPNISREDVMHGHFALGKIFQDCKSYRQAFYHYQEANAIYANRHSFKVNEYIGYVDYFINLLDKQFYKKYNFIASTSTQPIFVIGMSRAGKTLVEHILAKQQNVYNADEVAAFEKIAKKTVGNYDVKQYLNKIISTYDIDIAQTLASEYLNILNRNVDPDAKHIIDTTPTNFLFLGLIHHLFPNAKIIHCTRQPLDHCLQIYFKCFGQGNDYSYSLAKLAHYYLQYRRLMKHWQETLNIPMLEVNYEDLVLYSEQTAENIFNYLELPIEKDLLVIQDQDKKPLSTQEIGQWKHYDEYLELLKLILMKGGVSVNS